VAAQSLPLVVLASIVFYVAIHNLSIFLRDPRNRECLTFFAMCITICLYDVASALLYNAPTTERGNLWQRLQIVCAGMVAAASPWFVFQYYSGSAHMPRKLRITAICVSLIFLLLAIPGPFNPGGLYWSSDKPLVKIVDLPLHLTLTYYEMTPGVLTELDYAMIIALVLFLLLFACQMYLGNHRREARASIGALFLVLLCGVSDALISRGVYRFMYTVEYAFIGYVILATTSLTRKVVEAGRVKDALRESEIRFRYLVETTSDWIWEVNTRGVYSYVSPAVFDLLGYSQAEVRGKSIFDFMSPSEAGRVEAIFQEHALSGAPIRRLESSLRRKDGRRIDVETNCVPVFGASGEFTGYRGIDRDITERKRIEERLRQAQKMEAVGTLVGGIAHDFNNLLTAILGFASLLRKELPAGSVHAADAEAIMDSARRATELIRQLLAFSRKTQPMELRAMDSRVVIREVASLLSRTFDKSIAIETRLPDEPLWVSGNADGLHQAILNLCINARDAMPEGGRLSIEAARDRPAGRSDPNGDRVILSVVDDGVGMDAAVKERIFDPYFTTKEQGRGLGLAMVYGIIRSHGGEIRVMSQPDCGTRVEISLPAAVEPEAIPEPEPGESAGAEGGETVLVIDDEAQVRQVLARILTCGGYSVLLAEDGMKGIEIFGDRPGAIDLVILDISMPFMCGSEVYSCLTKLNPRIRVLLSSGYSADDKAAELLARKVKGFLSKPYTVDTVLDTVKRTLERV
jgi:PAS domain S-box-containing protein